jgi:hypothetical protein
MGLIPRVSVSGEFALDRSKQYRKNAANSLMLSREGSTRAYQDYWVTMAEFWFKLARHAEEKESAVADHQDEADKGMSRPVW